MVLHTLKRLLLRSEVIDACNALSHIGAVVPVMLLCEGGTRLFFVLGVAYSLLEIPVSIIFFSLHKRRSKDNFLQWQFHALIAASVAHSIKTIRPVEAFLMVSASGLLTVQLLHRWSMTILLVSHVLYVILAASWLVYTSPITTWRLWNGLITLMSMLLLPVQHSLYRMRTVTSLLYWVNAGTSLLMTLNVVAASEVVLSSQFSYHAAPTAYFVVLSTFMSFLWCIGQMCYFVGLHRQALTQETDVLVVGTGFAGLVAALRASETRRVVCVDAGTVAGGTTRLSGGGVYAPNNAWKRALGGEETLEQFQRFIETDNGKSLTERERKFVARYYKYASKALDFLVSKGVNFHLSIASEAAIPNNEAFCRQKGLDLRLSRYRTDYKTRNNPHGIARTLFPSFSWRATAETLVTSVREAGVVATFDPKAIALAARGGYLRQGNGAALVRGLLCALSKTNTPILLEKRLSRLTRETDGRWLAVFSDGSKTIARDVVLASGGAGANQKVVKQRVGGADVLNACTCATNVGLRGVIHPPPASRHALWLKQTRTATSGGWSTSRLQSWFVSGDYMFMVNDSGERFVNEYASYGERSEKQGSKRAFVVFDDVTLKHFGGAAGSPIPARKTPYMLEFASKDALVDGLSQELARNNALSAPAIRLRLARTVETFSSEGEDPLRKKDDSSNFNWSVFGSKPALSRKSAVPPFFAIELSKAILDTVGECDIDTDGNCLDQHGAPLGHLYAAGNCAAPLTDQSRYHSGGITLGKAACDGYVVGEILALSAELV